MLVAQIVALVLAAPQGVGMVIWVTAIVFVVARISDTLLVPKIMSREPRRLADRRDVRRLRGRRAFGLPGLLLGIPAAALIKVVWRFFCEWMASEQADIANVFDDPDRRSGECRSPSPRSGPDRRDAVPLRRRAAPLHRFGRADAEDAERLRQTSFVASTSPRRAARKLFVVAEHGARM